MRPILTHVALHVRDLDACIAFYQEFCHMQVVHERLAAGRRVVWLAEPGGKRSLSLSWCQAGQGETR